MYNNKIDSGRSLSHATATLRGADGAATCSENNNVGCTKISQEFFWNQMKNH
jgi:hypothetical protein